MEVTSAMTNDECATTRRDSTPAAKAVGSQKRCRGLYSWVKRTHLLESMNPRNATPLPTLLSFAVVAYTIEFDNEFERRLIEPTGLTFKTWKATRAEVFLISLATWANYLRFLPPEGLPVGQLARLSGDDERLIQSRLNSLQRWRYVVVTPPTSGAASTPKGRKKPPFRDWIARPTPAGGRCQALWSPLPALMEQRWRDRFGSAAIDDLRTRLTTVLAAHESPLPPSLPIISSRRGMVAERNVDVAALLAADPTLASSGQSLPTFALLAQTLLAFTLAFERSSALALPLCANVLRVLGPEQKAVRDLPACAGVSKEGIAQGLTLLKRAGLAMVERFATRPGQAARLTQAGQHAQANYFDQIAALEASWAARFCRSALDALRQALQRIVGDGDPAVEPLALGLRPSPCNWRAAVPPPRVLPHHPLSLDRGGWPDAA